MSVTEQWRRRDVGRQGGAELGLAGSPREARKMFGLTFQLGEELRSRSISLYKRSCTIGFRLELVVT